MRVRRELERDVQTATSALCTAGDELARLVAGDKRDDEAFWSSLQESGAASLRARHTLGSVDGLVPRRDILTTLQHLDVVRRQLATAGRHLVAAPRAPVQEVAGELLALLAGTLAENGATITALLHGTERAAAAARGPRPDFADAAALLGAQATRMLWSSPPGDVATLLRWREGIRALVDAVATSRAVAALVQNCVAEYSVRSAG